MSVRGSSRAPRRPARPVVPAGVGPAARTAVDLLRATVAVCLRWRVTGLAAEAGFFTLLSLPGLALSLAAAAAAVGRAAGPAATEELTRGVLETASRFLTPDVVEQVVEPTLLDALSTTRADLISVGLVFALWSGSRAVHVFVDAITIMYGLGGIRRLARARLQSMVLHLVSLVLAVVGLPLLVLGPVLIERVLPDRVDGLSRVLWPVAVIVATALLTTLYHVATPVRSPWWRDVPGAAAAVLVWFLASAALRLVVGESFARGASVYGPLTTAIVVMGWLYLLATAVLVGAALNAAVDQRWPVAARVGARGRVAPVVPPAARAA